MTEVSYHEFAASLPRHGSGPNYATSSSGVQQGSDDFVEPSLILSAPSEVRPSVVLISAPAAVGKTFFARQLSRDLNALYWNLAQFSLGSNFFVGTAVEEYGPEGYLRFVQELGAGQRTLVLDAADEALVRAGKQNYEAAIKNLAGMLSRAATPTVVILGRDDTIDDTAAVLVEQGVAIERWSVAYFDRNQASNFVKMKAALLGAPVMRELDEFLESFFTSVGLAMGATTWGQARSFIGYAPVLDAVATFYSRESNPFRVLEAIRQSPDDRHVWDLLVTIFEHILDREQDKFGSNFGGDDDSKAQFGKSVFSRDAQISYLLNESEAPEVFDFDDNLARPEWLAEVEAQLEAQLREHPFRTHGAAQQHSNPLARFANAAFRDFALAVGISDERLIHPLMLHAYWRSPDVNPTPILVGILFSLSQRTNRLLPPAALGMIHDSHAAADPLSAVILSTTSDFGLEGGSRVLSVSRDSGSEEDAVTVEIDAASQPPSFDRMLTNAFVDVYGYDVRLGDGFADFLIGPNVVMIANSLHSLVPEIRVRTARVPAPVFLSITSVGGMTRAISAPQADSLSILAHGGSLQYPWYRHVIELTSSTSLNRGKMLNSAMEVRQMYRWFSKPSMLGGGLRYPVAATESLVSKNRISSTLFDFLVDRRYLSREAGEYLLALPVASTVVFRNDLSDQSYLNLLEEYATWQVSRADDQ